MRSSNRSLWLVYSVSLFVLWMVVCLGSSSATAAEMACAPCNCYTLFANPGAIVMNCSYQKFSEVPEFIASSGGNFTNVTYLYLNNNFITRLDGKPFRELPKLEAIYLGYNKLNYIGNKTFYGMILTSLDLSANELTTNSFEDLAFEDLDVIVLDISRNQLSEPPKVLTKLKLVTHLIFHHNPMYVLQSHAFKGFGIRSSPERISGITTIDLSDCELEELKPNIFVQKDLPSLKNLYLDNNNFVRLNASFFQGARVASKLTIQKSKIEYIEKNTFKDIADVKYLYLNGNNLGNALDKKAFNKLQVDVLELRECGITRLTSKFLQMKISEELDLSGNDISIIYSQAFKSLKFVNKIILSNSNIEEIRKQPFTELTDLRQLYLNNNKLDNRSLNFLGSIPTLNILDISNNNFQALPDLTGVPQLHDLYAINNNITHIESDTFNTTGLIVNLRMSSNHHLEYIADDAFLPLNGLTELDFSWSSIRKLPILRNNGHLLDISVANAQLEELPYDLCDYSPKLTKISANGNRLAAIPDLSGCSSLSVLFFDFNKIKNISENTFQGLEKLLTLFLHDNEIEEIHPSAFKGLTSLSRLMLNFNHIPSLPKGVFDGLSDLDILQLQYNKITSIPTGIFKDLIHLQTLYINDNLISSVGETIFPPNMTWLQKLNISNNPLMPHFPIPKAGFPFLHTYAMMNLPLILSAPSLVEIPRIQFIYVTYPYHCCIYEKHLPDQLLVTRKKVKSVSINSEGGNNTQDSEEEEIWVITRVTAEPLTLPPHILEGHVFPDKQDPYNPADHSITDEDLKEILEEYAFHDNLSIRILPNNEIDLVGVENNETVVFGALSINSLKRLLALPVFNNISEVYCSPAPTAFMPCTSLLDPDPIRVLIWVVWFPAILGNIAVIFVIMASSEKVDVPNFILCNLALADFMLGIYLSFLAVVDVRTFGNESFYKSALHWQRGPGCKTAGFIGVFSCELSTYLMVILTLERLHTIVYSFNHQGSRMKMWHAVILVAIGWVFAMTSAVLPLFDISTYTDVAVCLPFRTDYLRDRIYVGTLLSLNLLASLVILFSYVHILVICCKSPAIDCRERVMTSVKLGILVVSNLACWLPFGVLGLAALAEEYLVNIIVAKYFIVLILPINACLNPFLYTISKKTFWQKCRMICRKRNDKKFQDLRTRRNSLASGASITSSYQQDIIDMDMVYRRQNRRSFSLQMETVPHTATCISSIPQSSSPLLYLERRNSSPAIFGGENIASTISGKRGKRMPSDPTLIEQTDTSYSSHSMSQHVVVRTQTEFNRTNSNCLSVVQEETSICGSDDEDINNHDSDIQSPFRFSAELKARQKANSDTHSRHSASEYVRCSLQPYSSNSLMMATIDHAESDCSSCEEYDDARSSPFPPQFTPPTLLLQHSHNPLDEDTGYCDSEELNRYSSTTVDTQSSGYSETTTSRLNHFEVNEIINPHINKPMKGIVESSC